MQLAEPTAMLHLGDAADSHPPTTVGSQTEVRDGRAVHAIVLVVVGNMYAERGVA